MEQTTMARPKAKPKGKTIAKTIAFKVSDPYAEWVDRFASFNRSTNAGLIDQALAEFAKIKGFTESPPER